MWVYLVMSTAETGTPPHGTQYPTTTLGLAARFSRGAADATATAVAAKARNENFIVKVEGGRWRGGERRRRRERERSGSVGEVEEIVAEDEDKTKVGMGVFIQVQVDPCSSARSIGESILYNSGGQWIVDVLCRAPAWHSLPTH